MLGRKGLTKLLNVGDIAPDFELEGTGGVRVSLAALLKRGAITLIFYPADNTPGWNLQLSAVRDEMTRFEALQVQPLGVNPASLESHERYAAQFRFPFPLLSDPGGAVALAYGAMRVGSRSVLRTVYVVGPDGRVAFAARGAPSVDEILAAVPRGG